MYTVKAYRLYGISTGQFLVDHSRMNIIVSNESHMDIAIDKGLMGDEIAGGGYFWDGQVSSLNSGSYGDVPYNLHITVKSLVKEFLIQWNKRKENANVQNGRN